MIERESVGNDTHADAERAAPADGLGQRYELLEEVGRGGLAVVYRALDRQLGRTVAVKLLGEAVARDPVAMERLAREARAMAALASPHIVRILDFGTADGRPYLVLEYLPDGSLERHLLGQTLLPARQVAAYGQQIAAGLAVAHRQGLVHRDVTLRNVLVAPDGRLKVADFGIAKLLDGQGLTTTGVVLGTVASMAPEQARGELLSPATDVYALGVALYHLATGRPPFQASTDMAIIMQHLQTPPTPPSVINPAVPDWLEAIILRALAKDPADHYPDGAAIEAALRQGLTEVTATPGDTTLRLAATATPAVWAFPPLLTRHWRWWLAALMAGLAGSLILGGLAAPSARTAQATPTAIPPTTATPRPPTATAAPLLVTVPTPPQATARPTVAVVPPPKPTATAVPPTPNPTATTAPPTQKPPGKGPGKKRGSNDD